MYPRIASRSTGERDPVAAFFGGLSYLRKPVFSTLLTYTSLQRKGNYSNQAAFSYSLPPLSLNSGHFLSEPSSRVSENQTREWRLSTPHDGRTS